MKIVASLTTTPPRVNLIQPTIHSILNQTLPIHSVELNIPYEFKRTGEKYEIPEWLKRVTQATEKVKVFRTEDYGAITKVAPTLIRHRGDEDTFIWSVDDDFYYPENMLAVIMRAYIRSKRRILSHSCGKWRYDKNKNCIGYSSDRLEGVADFIEGFATVLYPAKFVEKDFEEYLLKTSIESDNRKSDDIIISNYFKSKDIEIYNCGYPSKVAGPLLDNIGLIYGHNDDALHKQDGGNIARYIRVYNWLKKNNLNTWAGQQMEL